MLEYSFDSNSENHMSVFLKIKLKSLAAEARIIHAQERKTRGAYNDTRESLHRHRIDVVRRESRATHLAYGFLRGRKFKQMERKSVVPPDWDKVASMVKKYGATKLEAFETWKPAKPN
jgi:hypothetical protein